MEYAGALHTDSVSAYRRGERAVTFGAGLVPQISAKTKNALFLICAYTSKFLDKTKNALMRERQCDLRKLQNDRNDSSFLTFSKNIYARKKFAEMFENTVVSVVKIF